MRLDHIANAQGIDVGAASQCKGARGLFVDDFGECVAIHRVDVIVLVERKITRVSRLVGENEAVGRLTRCDDDLADAKLHRRLDDIVGAHRIDAKELVVGGDQDARDRGKVDDGIDRLRRERRVEFVQAGVA
ncbi:hypothetical protein D9M70_565860 [compost metagenome]